HFERRFCRYSYASRLGKGTHAALDRCTLLARRFPYVLRCDIVQFFPTMDHAVLRAQLARVIGDLDVLWLCDLILAGGVETIGHAVAAPGVHPYAPTMPSRADPSVGAHGYALAGSALPRTGEELEVGDRGLPIGNQTSQFWANVYLNPLDQFVTRELRCPGYVRYVDDFLLFAPDKPSLHTWRRAVIDYLATLRLSLHEPEAAVFPVATGIPFLGFRIYPDHRRLRRRNGVAFARRFRALAAQVSAGTVPVERLTTAVQGWVAHAAHADTYRLRASLLRRAPMPRYRPTRRATVPLQPAQAGFAARGPLGAGSPASAPASAESSPHEVTYAAR
ncbi:MAG: RNA-directed DNA polymerase, partial [Ktedonobacterales bacterium]